MTVRLVLLAPLMLGLSLLAGCVSQQGAALAMSALGAAAGGGLNPISAAVGMAGMAAANSAGMAQSAVISPQEKAKYAGMSCPELRQLTANYETALTARPAPKKYGGGAPAAKQAIAMQVITTRLAYLKQLAASQC